MWRLPPTSAAPKNEQKKKQRLPPFYQDGWYATDGLGHFQPKLIVQCSAFSNNTDFTHINIRFTAYFMVILCRDLDCYLHSFMATYTRGWRQLLVNSKCVTYGRRTFSGYITWDKLKFLHQIHFLLLSFNAHNRSVTCLTVYNIQHSKKTANCANKGRKIAGIQWTSGTVNSPLFKCGFCKNKLKKISLTYSNPTKNSCVW
jgi:hypothetical protein